MGTGQNSKEAQNCTNILLHEGTKLHKEKFSPRINLGMTIKKIIEKKTGKKTKVFKKIKVADRG